MKDAAILNPAGKEQTRIDAFPNLRVETRLPLRTPQLAAYNHRLPLSILDRPPDYSMSPHGGCIVNGLIPGPLIFCE